MSIGKVRKDLHLSYSASQGTRMFYNNKYKNDAQIIKSSEMFTQLKPRLQRLVFDKIYEQYYQIFNIIFSDCEKGFVREIMSNSQYRFYPIRIDGVFDPNEQNTPDI